MSCNDPKPSTKFESCISKENMKKIKQLAGIPAEAPLFLVEPQKNNSIRLLTETGQYAPGFPQKNVRFEFIDNFSIVRSHGSNHTTITSGGNSWSEEVPWW